MDFSSHGTRFKFREAVKARRILSKVISGEKRKTGQINFIFCNDDFLLTLNKEFLRHNTLTDILTFQYPSQRLTAEIYISVDRVKENAKMFKVTSRQELFRVMIHGVLHLCGYKDKRPADKKKMKSREDHYLKLVR